MMRKMVSLPSIMLIFGFILSMTLNAQFREYLIEGRIIDTDQNPIDQVVIDLQDKETSRSFSLKSDSKGKYKFAGLPHGMYSVRFVKAGYNDIVTEWDLHVPRERIQKIRMDDAIMVSNEELEKRKLNHEIKEKTDLAKQKYELKEYDAVIAVLDEVLKHNPDDVYSLYLSGMAYIGKEQFSKAEALFSSILEKNDQFQEAYIQLGYCYQKQNLLEKALKSYESADLLKPDQFMTLYNKGMILYQLNRYDEAIVTLEKALIHQKAETDILETIALCKINKKKYDSAVLYLKKAVDSCSDEVKKASLLEMIKSLESEIN